MIFHWLDFMAIITFNKKQSSYVSLAQFNYWLCEFGY